ncbi:MAG: hypothetical protein ACPGUZ_03450 [Holosporaceae bacterium]
MSFSAKASEPIEWCFFQQRHIPKDMVCIIKSLCLIAYNVRAHSMQLRQSFADDTDFIISINKWEKSELQNASILARWIHLADPTFDFGPTFKRFSTLCHLPSSKITPSLALLARCVYAMNLQCIYRFLASKTREPVLKALCLESAALQKKHYHLFYRFLKRYLTRYPVSLWRRIRHTAYHLKLPTSQEMTCAYFAANTMPHAIYHPHFYEKAYLARLWPACPPRIIRYLVVALVQTACVRKQNWWTTPLEKIAFWIMQRRNKTLKRSNKALIS